MSKYSIGRKNKKHILFSISMSKRFFFKPSHKNACFLLVCNQYLTHLSCFKILWILPFGWLQWLLILIAMAVSGSVLVITFWPAVRDDTKTTALSVMAVIVLLHALLTIGCKVVYPLIYKNYSYNLQVCLPPFQDIN